MSRLCEAPNYFILQNKIKLKPCRRPKPGTL